MAIHSSLKSVIQVVRTEGLKYPVGTLVSPRQNIYELPDGKTFQISDDALKGTITPPTNRASFATSPTYPGP
jgi:hypothetical protein